MMPEQANTLIKLGIIIVIQLSIVIGSLWAMGKNR